MTLLEARGLARHYQLGGETVRALDGVDFRVERGEYVAIIGPSGSGKSTLMNLIGCLDTATDGSYHLDGRDVAELTEEQLAVYRNQRVGFVFQSFHLLARQSAVANVALPLLYSGATDTDAPARAALTEVGLGDRSDHQPNELSGGQRQRVAIARALVTQPSIVLADEPTGNLDSRTSDEILGLLDDLHAKGRTLIVITHDPGVAARAGRVIRMLDGKIVEDKENYAFKPPPPVDDSSDADVSRSGGPGFMTLVGLAFSSLLGSRMRTTLSVLGVVIGVASVVTMLGLGQGAKETVAKNISALGTNLLTIRAGAKRTRHVRGVQVQTLVPADGDALTSQLPRVTMYASEVNGSAQLKYFDENRQTSVLGTDPAYQQILNFQMAEGRFLNDEDVRRTRKVCVLGATTAKELFKALPPIGAKIKIKGRSFEVIGVMKAKGAGGWRDPDDVALIPVSTAMRKLFGKRYLKTMYLSIRSRVEMEEATKEIEALLRERHGTLEGAESDFYIRSQEDLLQTMTGVTQTFTWLLAGVAAVSLLVGGIGIMNIMLVSVTERTREIGVRKALGATRGDVLRQFLTEAIVVTVAGGVAGVLVGMGAARLATHFTGWAISIPGYAYPLALGFSGVIGVFFGGYPAARAAALDPIECLRHE